MSTGDRIVKYLLEEGLKNYKIPLPPVISKRIGKYHGPGHDKERLCERHFPSSIPKGEGKKRREAFKVPVLFVATSLGICIKRKEHLIGVKIVENRYVLCLVSKFTIQKWISKNMDN